MLFFFLNNNNNKSSILPKESLPLLRLFTTGSPGYYHSQHPHQPHHYSTPPFRITNNPDEGGFLESEAGLEAEAVYH